MAVASGSVMNRLARGRAIAPGEPSAVRYYEHGQRQPMLARDPHMTPRAAEPPMRFRAIGDDAPQPPRLYRDFGSQPIVPKEQASAGPQDRLRRAVGKDHPSLGIDEQHALQ
jgi:hypothetical protein